MDRGLKRRAADTWVTHMTINYSRTDASAQLSANRRHIVYNCILLASSYSAYSYGLSIRNIRNRYYQIYRFITCNNRPGIPTVHPITNTYTHANKYRHARTRTHTHTHTCTKRLDWNDSSHLKIHKCEKNHLETVYNLTAPRLRATRCL